MTPRELERDETDAVGRQFSTQDLVLTGKSNWPAAIFFACMAILHACIAIQAFGGSPWEGIISAFLAACFMFVADLCLLSHSQITLCPRERQIHVIEGFGRFSFHRRTPFTEVRAVRVTLWESRRGPQSRLEILCNNDEIPCPPTPIPRQQALYLALMMNVRLIRVMNDAETRGKSRIQTAER